MAKKAKFQWTLPRAIYWLREALERGESEEVEPDPERNLFKFANGLRAEIDEKTRELGRFVFTVVPPEERVESFSWYDLPWGNCTAEGAPTSPLTWKTEPLLSGGTAEEESIYQDLLRNYLQPQWTDPCSGWCPDVADDLPEDWIDSALDLASDEGTFLVGVDEDGDWSRIFVVRSEKEARSVPRSYESVRELDIVEAYRYVNKHYPDSFDWPDSSDECYEEKVVLPNRVIEDRDIREAFAHIKSDDRWKGVHDGCRRACRAYVKLLALAVFNPELVDECRAEYEDLVKLSERSFRLPDWEYLVNASAQAGLGADLSPEVFRGKIQAIQDAQVREEEEARRCAALREQYTPQQVIEMFHDALSRWRAGELSVEEYDSEVDRVGELLEIVCSHRRPGANAAWREFEAERFPHACIVHGIE